MILLMGPAGAGKGTQAKLLVDKKGYSYISSGELLRANATEDQRTRMLKGELLSDEEIIEIADEAIEKTENADDVILDGVIRTVNQAKWLLNQVSLGRFKKPIVISLIISEEAVTKRLLLRGRHDDTEAGIRKRLDEYRRATVPVLEYFKDKGVPIHEVNAAQTQDAVHADIVEALERHHDDKS